MKQQIFARLSAAFPYIVALGLPLAGLLLAVLKLSEGDREDAGRILGAALLGCALYALLLTG